MKRLTMLALLLTLAGLALASTTGKITGVIRDAETGEPLIGVNVVIYELGTGAATNVDGYFAILNVPPGEYTLTANYIGYTTVSVQDVRVLIDLTTVQDFTLNTQALEGESVVIEASKPLVQKDVASSQRNLSSSEMESLPISSVSEAVGLQAGIEGMSIRFGGEDELVLMMDGVTLKDDRTGKPVTGIPLSSVKEVMVQSGGFNAEYSDLQAGLVNVVTREGSPDHFSFNLSYRYSPPAQKYFGRSMWDPNSYFLRPYVDDDVAWTGTDNGAWDEVTQLRYPAFQGWNSVSAQLLQDDDPSNDLTPTGAQRLFLWQARRHGVITQPDYQVDAGVGGPVPGLSPMLGNLRFYASVNANRNMYMIPLSRDAYEDRVGILRLTSDINSKIKLSLSAFAKEIRASSASETGQPVYFQDIWDVADIFGTNSQQSWKFLYPEYYCRTDISTRMLSAKLTNLLTAHSYYEALLEYSQTDYNTNPGPVRSDSLDHDIFPGDASFYTNEAPYGFEYRAIESIGGIFSMGLKSNSRDTSTTSRFKAKFDYTNQVNQYNQIKSGLQFEYFDYNMNYGAINPVLPSGRPFSTWHRSPYQVGLYVQDKVEFEGWIASLGLRAEYFDPNTNWYDVDPYDKTLYSSNYDPDGEEDIPTHPAKGTLTFLPRLGISHPISVNSKLYFNYGHMRQKFSPDELFGVRRVTGYQMSSIGDPSLPMEKTVAYEMGYDHSLFDMFLLHLSGYYKDKTDQASSVNYISADGTVNYARYANIFYQDIRGFELEARKYRGEWITGFANYTYAIYSSGRFGVRNYYQNLADQREELANYARQKQYKPLPRPRANFNLALHTPNWFGPSLAGNRILGDWNLSFAGYWKAGAYGTYGNVAGIVNNVRWKDTYNVDAKLSKNYNLGQFNVTLLAEAYNLFNFKHFSTAGMALPINRIYYEESLHFPAEVYEELGFRHLSGQDRLGDIRPDDVEYQPMGYLDHVYDVDGAAIGADEGIWYWVEEENQFMSYDAGSATWTPVPEADSQAALDNRAYIFNPPNESFTFLNPRDIYIGLRFSYNF